MIVRAVHPRKDGFGSQVKIQSAAPGRPPPSTVDDEPSAMLRAVQGRPIVARRQWGPASREAEADVTSRPAVRIGALPSRDLCCPLFRHTRDPMAGPPIPE
jgi:hypothetical protein